MIAHLISTKQKTRSGKVLSGEPIRNIEDTIEKKIGERLSAPMRPRILCYRFIRRIREVG